MSLLMMMMVMTVMMVDCQQNICRSVQLLQQLRLLWAISSSWQKKCLQMPSCCWIW